MNDSDPAVRIGSRHEARETALGLLYEAQARGEPPAAVLAHQALTVEGFAGELVRGVDEHLAELDALIERFATGWRVDRMPVLDAAVLRLGAFELCHRPDVPTTAIVAEAVELASEYSTDKSAPFVNGVLAAIAAEVRGRSG